MESEFQSDKKKIQTELANYLGIEPEDIEDESSLTEDLHMKATDLTDFLEILARMGYDTSGVDLTEIDTFLEFVESITDNV